MNAKAVIIAETNRLDTPDSPATFPVNYRSLGSHVVKGQLDTMGIESTVIDFCFHFDQEDLIKGVKRYFENTDVQYICISSALSQGLEKYYIELAREIKGHLPNAKILYGGKRKVQRGEMEHFQYVDAVFMGRAVEMLEDFVNNKDMSKYVQNPEFPNLFTNHNYNYELEKPVSYSLFKPDDFLNSTDVVGFEVALGCKFNCSFCNYPLRGAKTLYMNCEEQLYYTMQNAYDTYGITHFYAADDTLNESDEKLQLLVDVVKRLNFQPKITSFARLDVMAKRPHQIDMYNEIGMNAANFGVESFTKSAIKGARKKSTLEDLVYVVERLRKEIKDFWVSSNFIFGLANDNYEEFIYNLHYVERNRLIDNAGTIPLGIDPYEHMKGWKAPKSGFEGEWIAWDEGAFSDLDKFPEKSGYQIDPKTLRWSNDYTDRQEAIDKADEYNKELHQRNIITTHIEAFTWQSVLSQGIANSRNDWYDQMNDLTGRGMTQKANIITNNNIYKYVDKKLNWLINDEL